MVYRRLLHILFICIAVYYSSCQEANINKEIGFSNLLDTVLKQHKKLLNQLDSVKLNINIEACENRIALMGHPEINELQEQWLKEEINAYVNIKTLLQQIRTDLNFLQNEFIYSKIQIQSLKQDLIHRHLSKIDFYTYFTQEHQSVLALSISTKNINESYKIELEKIYALEYKLQEVFVQLKSLKRKNNNEFK